MKKLLMFLCAVMLVFAITGTARAATIIWQDNFNRATGTDLNGPTSPPGTWFENSYPGWVGIVGGPPPNPHSDGNTLMLMNHANKGTNPAWAAHKVDLSLYKNVMLSYGWKAGPQMDSLPNAGGDKVDQLGVAITYDGWITQTNKWFYNGGASSGWASNTINIGDSQSPLFAFRIWGKFNVDDQYPDQEWAKFDNVTLTGEPIPEPATIALLGIGVLGIAGAEARRRRKKKAIDNS